MAIHNPKYLKPVTLTATTKNEISFNMGESLLRQKIGIQPQQQKLIY